MRYRRPATSRKGHPPVQPPYHRQPLPIHSDRLDQVIDREIAAARIVGTVVSVMQAGQLIYQRAAGMADAESSRPMTTNAIFRLASITKPVVALTAMRLVEAGLIRLDDPVTRWLPDFKPALADGTVPVITLAQLMSHTAGLRYRFQDQQQFPELDQSSWQQSDGLAEPGITMADNLARITATPLAFAPGQGWRYSVGMDVLGAVLEAASGTSLPDLVRRLISAPLGLADLDFVARDEARLTTAYIDAPEGDPGQSDQVGRPVAMTAGARTGWGPLTLTFDPDRWRHPDSFPSGGAGMLGCASDVLSVLELIRRGGAPLLTPGSIAEMARPHAGAEARTQGPGWGFGLGFAVLCDPVAAKSPQAAGTLQWGGVYGHRWFIDPLRDLTVVTLTNTAVEGMAGRLPGAIRDAVYGL